jgi:hypothetical protein
VYRTSIGTPIAGGEASEIQPPPRCTAKSVGGSADPFTSTSFTDRTGVCPSFTYVRAPSPLAVETPPARRSALSTSPQNTFSMTLEVSLRQVAIVVRVPPTFS